ncbi:MAG: RAMP superfamily CRISPR-associated protein [Promethearchaeota archaeon]
MHHRPKSKNFSQRVFYRQSTSRVPFRESNSITIQMKAHVLENSYLFIGSGEESFENLPPDLSTSSVEEINEKLRIGFTPATLPITKKGDRQPIIPGSSLKGSIRHRIEHLFMFDPIKKFIHSCFINQSRGFIKINKKNRRFINIYGINGLILERGRDQPPNRVCIVCDLFGAPGLASRVFFSDASPKSPVNLLDVVIEEGGKFLCVPPDTNFFFQIDMINHKMYQTGLLLKGMNIPQKRPILLGQFKYTKNKAKKESISFGRVQFFLEGINERFTIRGKVQSKPLDKEKFVKETTLETEKQLKGLIRDIDEIRRLEDDKQEGVV